MNTKKKQKRIGKPVQMWIDESLYADFKRLVADYDPDLGVITAIRKVMTQAVKDYYLPGYLRRDRVREGGEPTGTISPKKVLTSKPTSDTLNQS